jgi:hypothetical protein
MKHQLLAILFCLVCLFPPLAAATSDEEAPRATVQLSFEALSEASLGEVWIQGEGISSAYAAFLDHLYPLFPRPDGSYWGLVAVPMTAAPGQHRLSVLVIYADGGEDYWHQDIQVNAGEFPSAFVTLPATLGDLGDPELTADELNLLDQYIGQVSPDPHWLKGLSPPAFPRLGAEFGLYRQFNGGAWQRHTGVDYPITTGTPVLAPAAGQVVLVATMPIRGNYILLDHGGGLFSGYAHLSAVLVAQGDRVEAGQVLGEVGSTGRSTGPHLHWEIALGGVWIDPFDLLAYFPQ